MKRLAVLAALTVLGACQPAVPPAKPHYVLGDAYLAGGVWHYPHETFDSQQTGIATVYPDGPPRLTADGETYDPNAMAAAHQTLQLPAIVRVTNLNNGLAVEVRVNDRGPDSPHRLIEVTPRVAQLLEFPPSGVAPVRVTVLPGPSHRAVDQLGGSPAPQLALKSAPVGSVQADDLPPPPGVRQSSGGVAASPVRAAAPALETGPEVPLRLPETRTREAVGLPQLWIQLGTFSRYEYARLQRAKVGGAGARIEEIRNGRTRSYRVRIGPLATIAEADAALDQVIGAGVTDARIIAQ
ncbi:MAG: SPOR domain-containing protein [Proteobacteria bacterium]|nr:SPOR domain-containing protein [Pseudomonadota bacterium]